MRAVVQRAIEASIAVDGKTVARISSGLVAYVSAGTDDDSSDSAWISEKIANLRVFEDERGAMNLSLLDLGLEALVVSQFTLHADARKGRRPSFSAAARPERAEPLVKEVVARLRSSGIRCETGVFGADMKVAYVNDGPITILLDSKKAF